MSKITTINDRRTAGVATSAAFASIFVFSFIISLPSLLINEVVETFNLDGASEGLMGSLANLGFVLSLVFVMLIQGRVQKLTLMIIASVAQAIMLAICGFSPTFILFCVGYLFLGFSGGFIDSNSNSILVDVHKNNSAKYMGYLHGFFGVGALVAPLIFIWALRNTDWRGIHYAIAAVSMAVAVFIFLISRGRKDKPHAIVEREHLFTKKDLVSYLKIKRNIALTLAGTFTMFTVASSLVWIVRYFALVHNSEELGMLSVTVYWICATVNRFLLTGTMMRAPMFSFALGSLLSGVFIFIGVVSGNAILLCIMMGAFGLCSGHFIPILFSEGAVGYEGRTTFTTSFLMLTMGFARVVAPVMIAYVSTQISLTVGMMLPVAAALLGTASAWYAKRAELGN